MTGYTLSKPVVNQQVPNWFPALRESTQGIMDGQYLHSPIANSLDRFYAACEVWLAENTRLRNADPDPEHYRPTPAPVIPKREIYDWDPETGTPVSRWEQDPSVKPPALPAYQKPVAAPNAGFVSTAAQAQTEDLQKYALLVKMLSDLTAKVNAIAAKVGVN